MRSLLKPPLHTQEREKKGGYRMPLFIAVAVNYRIMPPAFVHVSLTPLMGGIMR